MDKEIVPVDAQNPVPVLDLRGKTFGEWWMEEATDEQRRAIVDFHGQDSLRRIASGELTPSAIPETWKRCSGQGPVFPL